MIFFLWYKTSKLFFEESRLDGHRKFSKKAEITKEFLSEKKKRNLKKKVKIKVKIKIK